MNTENIKNAILSQAEANNAIIVEALMAVRDNFTDKFVGKFVADVIWTIFGGYQKYSKWRISEKQANVIAEFVATIPVKSLMANLTKEQVEALGFELTEEAKEVPAKTMETLKAMSCNDAEVAEIIAEVIETGKVTKSQALAISKYIASHKDAKNEKAEEQTEEVKNETTVAESATVEDIASSKVVGNQDETEEGKVSEVETLATSTSEGVTVYTGVLLHPRQEARHFCTEAEARDYLMQSKKGTHIEVLIPGEERISGFRDTVNGDLSDFTNNALRAWLKGDLERYKGNIMKKASRAHKVSCLVCV